MKARIRVELVSVTMRPIVPYTSLRSSIPPFAVQDASVSEDRKSTRLNSSHSQISYAVFCLKKKKNIKQSLGRAHATAGGSPDIGGDKQTSFGLRGAGAVAVRHVDGVVLTGVERCLSIDRL